MKYKSYLIFAVIIMFLFLSGMFFSRLVKSSSTAAFFAYNKIIYIRFLGKINSNDILDRSEGYILAKEMGLKDLSFLEKRYIIEKNEFIKKIILRTMKDMDNRKANDVLLRIFETEKNENLKKYINALISDENVSGELLYDQELVF